MLLRNENKETGVLLSRDMVKKPRTENKEIGETGGENKGHERLFQYKCKRLAGGC
jgi:hypothetical protein